MAEAGKAAASQRTTPKAAELESAAQTQPVGSEQLAASVAELTAELTAQKEKLAAAKQKVADLGTTLNIPQDISSLDAATALGREDLRTYRPYFEARSDFEQEERFTHLLEMKTDIGRAGGHRQQSA